jgi:nitroreductase
MKLSIFQNRKSTRRFMPTVVEPEKIGEIMELNRTLAPIVPAVPQQFIFIQGKEYITELLAKFLLSYGKLISAPHLLLPFYEPVTDADLEIGYRLEYLVLKATDLDLGTLWISADEGQKMIEEAVLKLPRLASNTDAAAPIAVIPKDFERTREKLILPVLILIGYASEKRLDRIINNAVRMESAGNSRKRVEAIVINRKSENIPENIRKILNQAILAPSKKNQQPWRVRITDKGFDLGYLHDRELDAGIFLSHLKVSMEIQAIPHQIQVFHEKSNEIEWLIHVKMG